MVEVKFYDEIDDRLLKFAVILSKTEGKWVFCKHKERETYEVPGGFIKRPCNGEEEPALMAFYESLGYVRAASRFDKSNAEGSDRLYHIYVKFLRGAGDAAMR